MSQPSRDLTVALDFGTTNSALALHTKDGVELARFLSQDGRSPTYPSVLYFDPENVDDKSRPMPITGPQGIELYLEDDGEGRLVQSLKSYLVSRSFNSTSIFGRRFTLEELVLGIIEDLRAEAEAQFGPLGGRIVVGRPVHFTRAVSSEDDAFAIERLSRAVRAAGFDDIAFVYEPVAAAYHYESQLDRDELVLIADFGGGTSDFTLIEVGPSAIAAGHSPDTVHGTHGVPVAGNAFDYGVVRALIAPHLGLGSYYKTPFGKALELPPSLYRDLEWHRLSLLNSSDARRSLENYLRTSLSPDKVEAFLHIVTYHMGYHLYRSVEQVKIALSSQERAMFSFVDDPIKIEFPVTRAQFEACIEEPLSAISSCVDELMRDTNTAPEDVDRVFMTGGSSFVPAVRRIFTSRFGADKVAHGDELTSIVSGLARSTCAS